MKMELRVNPTSMVTNDDGTMTVSGYVNETEKPSNMLGRNQKFVEIIKRGAWQKAVENANEVHFYAEHDPNKILASTRNGSLQLREDDKGLYMEATISPTTWGKDYYQLIKDGILRNMSFGFRAVKDAWRNLGDHFERTVGELELFEVSVVRDPAYSQSSIAARGIDLVEDVEIPSEVENPVDEPEERKIDVANLKVELRAEDIEALAEKVFKLISEKLESRNLAADAEDVVEEENLLSDPDSVEDAGDGGDDDISDNGSGVEDTEIPADPEDPDNDGDNDVDPEVNEQEDDMSAPQRSAQNIKEFTKRFREGN